MGMIKLISITLESVKEGIPDPVEYVLFFILFEWIGESLHC